VTNALYDATVAHVRRIDPPHSFAHRVYLWLVDLDAPPVLPWWLRPFARIDRRDHFVAGDPRGIREKLDSWLADRDVDLRGGKVVMLAAARVLGYAFNPISVYWCHDPDGGLACVVAEVHNTYGGRHAYLLPPDENRAVMVTKKLYVSPFNEVDGYYLVRAPRPDAGLDVTISLHREHQPAFVATLRGKRLKAGAASVTRMQFVAPMAPLMGALGIRVQGITLWLRRVPVVPREASCPMASEPAVAQLSPEHEKANQT